MTDTTGEPRANAEQGEFWNGSTAQKWTQQWEGIDRLLAPLSDVLVARTHAQPGERIIDVGCGHGTTTLALASQVTSSGKVLGVDISGVMLETARRRANDAELSHLSFAQADATTHPFPAEGFDVAFSRFGIMFFEDPVASFKNIGSGLKPGGRLTFACWQAMEKNPWLTVGMEAAMQYLEPPEPPEPGSPGAFAFADPERVRTILADAGFHEIEIEPLTPTLRIGASPEDATRFFMEMGPVASLIEDADPDLRPKIAAAMIKQFQAYTSDDGVQVGAAAWLTSARR
ncbi:MAG: class I SAM-dependent methyltransferase [Myxococcota bacterium]